MLNITDKRNVGSFQGFEVMINCIVVYMYMNIDLDAK